jgi:hypothetical protein
MWLALLAVVSASGSFRDGLAIVPRSARPFRVYGRDLRITVDHWADAWVVRSVSPPEVQTAKLQMLRRLNPRSRVIIDVEHGRPFGEMRRLVVQLSEAGFRHVTFAYDYPCLLARRRAAGFELNRDESTVLVPKRPPERPWPEGMPGMTFSVMAVD